MKITVFGEEELLEKFNQLSKLKCDALIKKTAVQVFNRGKEGGTPVSTELTRPHAPHGELRQSLGVQFKENEATVFYLKDYAPHVEYGHRTKGGGFVQGQRFLQANVDAQRDVLKSDLDKYVSGKLKGR